MNVTSVLRFVGLLLMWTGAAMLPSTIMAAAEGLLIPWISACVVSGVLGASLYYAFADVVVIDHREGLVVVGVGWLAVVTIGSLPFVFTRVAPSLAAAIFESVSGFTTTGATIFADPEALPRSVLLWRSVTHWIGGMGIIVLGVAILPFLGVGGAQLFRAEAPGISTDRLRPRIASTARLLWTVYATLTGLLVVIYLLLGMTLFDAVNHAMSTLATGGFSTKTASMAAFSPAIQWVTIGFMLLAGTNFALHYRVASGRIRALLEDAEWRVYVSLALIATTFCFVALGLGGASWDLEGLRTASFNVVSILTTTGFATDDFALWPTVTQVVLVGLMFVGAMGGSTGGGLKVIRALVLAKHTASRFRMVLHPHALVITRLGRRVVGQDAFLNVVELFALYVATHAAGTLLLTALGYDFVTSMSAALAAMSSIGPGLGDVGPMSHYGFMGGPALLTLSALMLLGRLEFYTLLILFFPETWARTLARRNRGRKTPGVTPKE